MERSLRRLGPTLIKNALANVVRGGATAVVALTLPHFLTRALDHDRFAAWALMLQIAAYVGYLDFGIQTVVARYLAQLMERGNYDQRDRLVSTAFAMLSAAGIAALVLSSLMVWQFPRVVHGISPVLLAELRLGVLVLALSAALMLPLSVFAGVLVGLHRNEFTALTIGGSRILGAAAVLVAVHYTHSLFWLAVCLGFFNLLGGTLQCVIALRMLPQMRLRIRYVNKQMAQELLQSCLELTVYSFSMLLVSGLDVLIVGYSAYDAVGYYAISATLVTFVAGLSNSVFAAMLAPVAVLQERGELRRICDLVIRTTRLGSYLSLVITLPVFVYGFVALKLWVGPTYAGQALPILEVLMVAQAIRLIGNSYCTMLIATGQQKYGMAVALIEASSNLVFSIVGMLWFGPIGVAWGTLIGALIAIVCLFPFSMRKAKKVPIPEWLFFHEGILRPILVAMPVLLYLVFTHSQSPSTKSLKSLVLVVGMSLALALIFGNLLSPKSEGQNLSHVA
jgi:O-antigen/teichoic acid export membrane protein